MRTLALSAALSAGLLLSLPSLPAAHGGQYRGPGDLVPPGGGGFPGGGGPGSAGPVGAPAPAPPGSAPVGGTHPGQPQDAANQRTPTGQKGVSVDLTQWTFWWESNKEPYLDLKAAIHSSTPTTGSDGWWLGSGQRAETRSLRPTREQIQGEVVPALIHALANETSNDIVTACLIALAKIGDEKNEDGTSRFAEIIAKELSSPVQEIAETAAVALGILANDGSVPTLTALLADDTAGRTLVGAAKVDERTRSFAAYGLAQIGARTGAEDVRREIVGSLHTVLSAGTARHLDLGAACVIALGLVPLETLEPGTPDAGPAAARRAQIEYLLSFLADEEQNPLTRAHVPTALARLFRGPDASRPTPWPGGAGAALEKRIVEALLDALATSRHNAIQSGCVLALGLLGDLDGDPLDTKIRAALAAAPKAVGDQQTRFFSLIAMARLCGNPGNGDVEPGLADVQHMLLTQLSRGKSTARPWAGLAIGVACEALASAGIDTARTVPLKEALREALRAEKSSQRVGAYAIASGIARDLESAAVLRDKLERLNDDEARGYASVALGLLGEREAVGSILDVLRSAKYRPTLLKQAAVALGLLGNKEVVDELTVMLQEAESLASQAAVASALGIIGDAGSIEPLVALLADTEKTDLARAFAAAALGIVGDKESLPWNAKIGVDLNYRASTPTLNDPAGATGILNIL